MIARIWKGVVRREDADAYVAYIGETGLAAYAATPGNRGAWMLRRDDGEQSESITLSMWDSRDAIRASPATTSRRPSSTPRTSGTWSRAARASRATRS
jgi:heme-degrading monooxygenase HmoA